MQESDHFRGFVVVAGCLTDGAESTRGESVVLVAEVRESCFLEGVLGSRSSGYCRSFGEAVIYGRKICR